MIRRAETDADLAAWCGVWNAITPREPNTVEVVRRRLERQPERLYLLAEEDGEVVGTGFAGPSQSPERTALDVRVLPGHRRRGIGSELLDRLVEHASGLGPERVSGMLFEDDPESIAWARKRGFEESGRQVELSRELGAAEEEPTAPPGIELAELHDRHLQGAYAVWVEATPDIPVSPPIRPPSYDEWLEEEVSGPVTFVALDSDRVVGAAALLSRIDGLAEHGLTAVLRSHRGRGIGTALKQAQIHWGAANGYRELTTWTQDRNEAMQAVNVKLGYQPRPAVISVWRRL
ncbi:MAG TPA: GNAT family N-acetyltransferase [Gaiellaceae bacterium]|nr:GNAT family N-acetyltransferase [Gaiellaceae bacterium]